jgi:hypothetical protein
LGIYLSKDRATAVVLSHKGSHVEISGCLTVTAEPPDADENEPIFSLASRVAQALAARRLSYGDVAVSLDCASYTQHNLHSDFTDHKQIGNTIAFDAEEALACDATEMALAFNVTATDDHGSNVTVFTSDRRQLAEQLSQLQRENLDPTVIEPDILCLARYIEQNFTLPGESSPLFVVASDRACYIINLQGSPLGPLARSFILGESQDLTTVLRREIPLTIASLKPARPINGIFIMSRPDDIDLSAISESTGIETHSINLSRMVRAGGSAVADCKSEADFAIAYGAALGQVKRTRTSDFRRSFAPYQGKRLILQRSLRAISIFATISLVTLGIYFQLKVIRRNDYVSRLKTKLVKDFSAVTGKTPSSKRAISRQLAAELTKAESGMKGGGDENSVTAKLTHTLEALHSSPKSVDLKITSINITRLVKVSGDTNSKASTLAMLKSFKDKAKLEKTSERFSSDKGRDKFDVTFELKR